jgi:hypothetical protein
LLGTLGELGGQSRLAEARLTGYEADLSLALQHELEPVVELLQLLMPTHEDPMHRTPLQ